MRLAPALAVAASLAPMAVKAQEEGVLRDWDLGAQLSLGATVTDNVNREPDNQAESDLIWRIEPNFSAHRQGAGLNLDLDYNLQGLIFTRDGGDITLNQQLLGTANAELLDDRLFLDARSTIRQAVVSPQGRISLDNIAQGTNRADVYTLRLSPYWTSRFGDYAQALARYTFDVAAFEEGASDSLANAVNLNLNSGSRFQVLGWSLGYAFSDLSRQDGEDTRRQSLVGQTSYRLNRQWSLLGRAGYENNDSPNLTTEDGGYGSVGASWQPSRHFAASALYGPDDNEFTVSLNPTTRTALLVTRRDREVGVSPGERFSGTFRHQSRFGTWSASYVEETSSVQELQFTDTPFLRFINPLTGEQIFTDLQGNLIPLDDLLTLTDVEFLRERFEGTFNYERGRSRFIVRAFSEDRDFERALQPDESAFGGSAGWIWRFAPKTRSSLRGEWQRSEDDDGREDDLWETRLGLNHRFAEDLDGSVEYRHGQRDSNQPGDDYTENRLTLFLRLTF
ncbi:MAG: TIGR03016 family PEP-CTERM system-associated outer membrane protein [Pseudomonadota bacterium]|nr:TIGR03016 family PEP-CTERM system-associated outer membrane protein [Pseudomonadota bacterium]